jgi:uncharacterized protein (DUF1697 family)
MTMSRYIVLLRGINVGKAKRVPMADLKALLLGLGCTRAVTLLNSGNAVVEHARITSAALARTISEALGQRFGFEVPVIVKSAAEFDAIVAANELLLPPLAHPQLLVGFAQSPQAIAALEPLARLIATPERLVIKECAAYLYCANGILACKAADALLGPAGKGITTRNWATVMKIHAQANTL